VTAASAARTAVLVAAIAGVAVVAGLAVGTTATAGAPADAVSPTYVGENVTEDATWTAEDGPYVVTTDVTVADGATLTDEAGTTVYVGEDVAVTVAGSLVTQGTADQPVAFTTQQPNPAPGDWETLRYVGDGDSRIRLANTTVEYAQTAISVESTSGRVAVVDSTLREHVRAGIEASERGGTPRIRVADSTVADTGYAGIAVEVPATDPHVDHVAAVSVTGTDFEDPGQYGLLVRARHLDRVAVSGGSVSGFDAGGVVLSTGARVAEVPTEGTRSVDGVSVTGVTVSDGTGPGVAVESGHLTDVSLSGNDVARLDGTGIAVQRAADLDDVSLSDNTVTEAATGVSLTHRRGSGPVMDVSVELSGNDLRRNDRFGLRVEADLLSVERLAVRDNALVENGFDGAFVAAPVLEDVVVADNHARGNGGSGVELAGGRVEGVVVEANRLAGNADGGLRVRARSDLGPVTVADNALVDNAAVGASVTGESADGPVAVRNNSVLANTVGLRLEGPSPVRVTNNTVAFNTRNPGAEETFDGVGPSTGVVVLNASASGSVTGNDVYGHIVGLRAATDGTLDATENYWGAESGPFYASVNPDGDGNAVQTDGDGNAGVVPFAETHHRTPVERPTAVLDANRTEAPRGGEIRFSAADSGVDGDATYHFVVDGRRLPGQSSPVLVTAFDDLGRHEVAVTVEDGDGVESIPGAAATVDVVNRTETTTTTTTQQPDDDDGSDDPTTTTTPGPGSGDDGGDGAQPTLASSLLSPIGLLGDLLWLLAVVLGGYGVILSIRGEDPPIGGTVVHGLAAAGAVVWVVGGLLWEGPLLLAGVGAGVAWAVFTAAVVFAATR
jgi:hypothetical protein